MKPFIVLLSVTAVARLAGLVGPHALDSWAVSASIGLAAMFALTGWAHFAQPMRGGLIAMVPPALPARARLVDITGVLELAGGVGLLIPGTRPYAAGALFVLLLLMFPANVSAAKRLRHTPIVTMPLPARTAVQGVFLGACALVVLG
jgi:uncharacterized membrane protein